jgi:HK97 gp10 family phage protein
MKIRMRLVGRPAVSRKIRAMTAALSDALATSAEAAVLPLENRWKELVPVRTGTYRRSIHHEPPVVMGDQVSIEVGTDIVEPPYPFFLEFGTSRMAPRPSARPALDETQGAVQREFSASMRQLMASIG